MPSFKTLSIPRTTPVFAMRRAMSVALLSAAVVTTVVYAAGIAPITGAHAESDGWGYSSQGGGDWPLSSFDYRNSNFNRFERTLKPRNVSYLRRAWSTFNDDTLVFEPAPSGFVLEAVLGLEFPNAVAGVVASPIIRDGTIYYVDVLGTVFARDARSGESSVAGRHWTTTLVDPDYDNAAVPVLPELIYTAPIVTADHVFVLGSSFGRLHVIERDGGAEVDFDPTTVLVDPFQLVADLPFSSILGEAVIVNNHGRSILIAGINVILNDALVQGEAGGLQIAYDVTDPTQPVEVWRRPMIETDPATGEPFGAGVSAGSGLAIDLRRGYLFGGTGQNTVDPYAGYPDPALAPPGYVDRSDSLYAIDIASGEFVWSNQFHNGDVFNLNDPVSTGPNQPDGPRDADVLSPPVLFSARVAGYRRALVGNGSKGGLFRVVNRDTGESVWERQISKPTGIGGIQAGAAVAGNVIYVAGFEGIDDGFSDAQFGVSLQTGLFGNAFFATFSPSFWADVEDTSADLDPATGMRIKLYALDTATGQSRWQFDDGTDYVELASGAALRHVSATAGLVYVTTSSGTLFILDARNGDILFSDQTLDLDQVFELGLGKPHHASMNAGTIISDGMVYVGYGAQNNPSGGMIAYELNRAPKARSDFSVVRGTQPLTIHALSNDSDANGDRLRFAKVANQRINTADHQPDVVVLGYATITVFNQGDDSLRPHAAYLHVQPNAPLHSRRAFRYVVEDVAPRRKVNGVERAESEPTHTPRRDAARVHLFPQWQAPQSK
jgi:outer membrane protein assembly factor BamB